MNSPFISWASCCPLSLLTACLRIKDENVGLHVRKKKNRYIEAVSLTACDFFVKHFFSCRNRFFSNLLVSPENVESILLISEPVDNLSDISTENFIDLFSCFRTSRYVNINTT